MFSRAQMDYVVQTWVDHFLHERPHRGKGIGNRVLDPNFQPQTKAGLTGLVKSIVALDQFVPARFHW